MIIGDVLQDDVTVSISQCNTNFEVFWNLEWLVKCVLDIMF